MMTTPTPTLRRRIFHYTLVAAVAAACLFLLGADAAPTPVNTPEYLPAVHPSPVLKSNERTADIISPPPPIPDFWKRIKPAQPNPPSAAMLADWSDPSKYGVWVNGERVANRELKNYSAGDFAHYFQSGLEKNARDYGKYTYHIDVYTVDHFKKYNKIFPDGTFEPRGRPTAPAENGGTGLYLPDFDRRLLRLAGARPDPAPGEGC